MMTRDAVMQVPDGDWMGTQEAATHLGVPMWRLRVLIANGHVLRARNSTGEVGVARDTVHSEAEWRKGASPTRRVWRLMSDIISWGP